MNYICTRDQFEQMKKEMSLRFQEIYETSPKKAREYINQRTKELRMYKICDK